MHDHNGHTLGKKELEACGLGLTRPTVLVFYHLILTLALEPFDDETDFCLLLFKLSNMDDFLCIGRLLVLGELLWSVTSSHFLE